MKHRANSSLKRTIGKHFPRKKKGKNNIIRIYKEIFFFIINIEVKESFFTLI